MTFNTRKFESSHGKMPRGYGMWGFVPADKWDAPNYLDHVMWHTGTYADAKKNARVYFAARNVSEVVVCP